METSKEIMEMPDYAFRVVWDSEASVWFTESEEIKGLVAESPTLEGLHEKLLALIPEMLELNHSVSAGKTFRISLKTRREFRVA